MPTTTTLVFAARLAGIPVFDPLGDQVGRVRDIVVHLTLTGRPAAVGLVVEVPGRRRIFLPLTRVTSIAAGQVISTGLLNIRRFQKRPAETLVLGELLDRTVQLRDGSGEATIEDAAIEQLRTGDWVMSTLFVRRKVSGHGLGFMTKRGETLQVPVAEVTGLLDTRSGQGAAALLATYEGLKPADLADLLHDMAPTRRQQVAAALDDERLADVLEELGDEDRIEVLSSLGIERAADVLDEMQPDDAADLVRELPEAQATVLLERMEPDEARDVRRLLAYDEYTAGGMMTSEPVILTPETTIASALASVRRADIPPSLATIVFVSRPPSETPTGRFLGVVHLQRMLRHPPHLTIGSIIDSDIEALAPEDKLGKVTRLLATYNLTALPVLDDERRLLGAVSADDVLDHLLPEHWRETDDDATDRLDTPSAIGEAAALQAAQHLGSGPRPGPAQPADLASSTATARAAGTPGATAQPPTQEADDA